jgi:hypothetical protein
LHNRSSRGGVRVKGSDDDAVAIKIERTGGAGAKSDGIFGTSGPVECACVAELHRAGINCHAAGKGIESPTEIKADLFSKSANGDIGIPANVYGTEEPTSENGGNVYAGIVAFKPGKLAGERSYITIQLMQGKEPVTLKKGLTYCIEYAVSLSESSKFACNNLGAYLSKDKPGNGEPGAIYMAGDHVMKAQVNKVYNGFFGWEKVCNTYTAKGDEKYINHAVRIAFGFDFVLDKKWNIKTEIFANQFISSLTNDGVRRMPFAAGLSVQLRKK